MSKNCISQDVQVTMPASPKRCHLDGAHIEWTCPTCGRKHKEGLDGDSISYPEIGKPYDYGVACHDWENCGFEGDLYITISMSVRGKLGW
jgi:hypothetical protein